VPTIKLTAKAIDNIKPPTGGRTEYWDRSISSDTSLPGSFGLRVTPNGAMAWVLMYRVDNPANPNRKKQRRMTIGGYPAFSLAVARDQAREMLKLAGQGVDPVEARTTKKTEVANEHTVGTAVELFLERHSRRQNKPSTAKEVERVFNVYVLPIWSKRPISSIAPADVDNLIEEQVAAGNGYMANRLLAHTRKFLNWCVERRWLDVSPAAGIKAPAKEVARDRILTKDEIVQFWNGCNDLGWPFGPALKLLLLTGQRRDEVARMQWSHLDLDEHTWTLPKQETKAGRQHEVPLPNQAIEIIKALPRNGDFVFTTTGKTPISGFSKIKVRLDEATGIESWRFHDLRRTTASGMAEIGIAPHVIEKVLNHSTGQISGVAAVYNRHAYRKEMSEALNAWARTIERLVSPGGDNIIELRGR
jgi:integrase